jgi:hypothetical protein
MNRLEKVWQDRYDGIKEVRSPDIPILEGDRIIGIITDSGLKKLITLAEELLDELATLGEREDVPEKITAELIEQVEMNVYLAGITIEKVSTLLTKFYKEHNFVGKLVIGVGWKIIDRENGVEHPKACGCRECNMGKRLARFKRPQRFVLRPIQFSPN